MRTGRTPKVRTARKPPDTERSLRRAPWNAAGEVPQPTKKRVLMRKARDADVYWSTLGIAERSASGSATYYPIVTLVTLAFWSRFGTFTVSTPSLSTAVRPAVSASLR